MSEAAKIELKMTSTACPEQYDAFLDGRQVGYLRLRWGIFRVDYQDCGGETLLCEMVAGDGEFEPSEREGYLERAKAAILRRLERGE